MSKWETIWERARAALVLASPRGDEDVLLWEHSSRVARLAMVLAELPEAKAHAPDESVVLAAGLFHDAAWIVRLKAGDCERHEILSRPLAPQQREASARHMEQALRDVMSPLLLDRAVRVIRQYSDRGTIIPEARVLADAENLDELSLASLWPVIRRGATEGKGVQSVLEQWQRRKEYQFWTSRLKDGFHFAASREIAGRRLHAYELVMEQLRIQQQGEDLS